MNYRHAFHAGNFADVHKHVALTLIVQHLRAKPTPFRIIDTHAGAGLYDLTGPQSSRTNEWRSGVGRLLAYVAQPDIAQLLAPYREVVGSFNRGAELTCYPGSPLIARAFLRENDRLIACELHPEDAAALADNLGRIRRAKAIAIDGWTALGAYIPPPERRGLVLIDPPYEQPDEFAQLARALVAAYRKWPTGIYLCWYPIKDREGPDQLADRLAESAIANILRSEFLAPTPAETGRLVGSGLIVINPPWRLEQDLRLVLPEVAAALGGSSPDGGAAWLKQPA